MNEETPLDVAHAEMEASPDEAAARLAFYARVADSELFLLLEEEATGEHLNPRVFPLEAGPVVLAFDTEARLSDFAGGPAAFAALPGRVLAQMLAGQGLGLGLNLDAAPSATLLQPDAVEWLAGMLGNVPHEMIARPAELCAPAGLPEALLRALDGRLARAAGLATCAWFAAVRYDGGGQGHLLAFVDAEPAAERALAQAVGEALAFSGLEAGAVDVAFLSGDDPLVERLGRTGMRFDLPKREPARGGPTAPGTDPDRPPRLR